MDQLGVHLETSTSEAAAGAMLARVDQLSDPRRGDVEVAGSAPTSRPTVCRTSRRPALSAAR